MVDKIGREEVESAWREEVKPFLEKHRAVFLEGGDEEQMKVEERGYSLERFHWAGSCVLSRSFHVESGEGGEGDSDSEEESDDDEEEEEKESVSDVAMVPLADLLNAQSGLSNVRSSLPSSLPFQR